MGVPLDAIKNVINILKRFYGMTQNKQGFWCYNESESGPQSLKNKYMKVCILILDFGVYIPDGRNVMQMQIFYW